MAEIDLDPILVEDATLTIGGDDYSTPVDSAVLTPSSVNPIVHKGINGKKKTRIPKADWTLELSFGQDVTTAKALTLYTFDHEGEVVPFTLEPKDGGPVWSGNVVLVASAIGGGGDGFANATVSLPCDDRPARTGVTP
ncbi:hypothetical protein [Schumannella soli]|uniref:Phage tail protein n=1 Tax=Schumannella soli TaxID=2590779 RepID=A0A506Y069_9MICO|nr:hypothetical protein [Schumannella soli]TPW75896.1 hypothetical protein FJ657_08595 [Schumannella soli]